MIVDFETTGLDPLTCGPVEVAAVVVEPDSDRVIASVSTVIYEMDYGATPLSDEVSALTGLTDADLLRHGIPAIAALSQLEYLVKQHKVTHVVAHNGEGYDRKIMRRFCPPLAELPWVDTITDVPYPNFSSRKLIYLAAEYGFVNPFPHSALGDCLTVLRILRAFPWKVVEERSRSPFVFVRADVSYDDRQLAKDQRYFWERFDDFTLPKAWIKRLKECDLAAESARCPFPVRVIK
jgi:DNA polymerase-3 subunit epsilon